MFSNGLGIQRMCIVSSKDLLLPICYYYLGNESSR